MAVAYEKEVTIVFEIMLSTSNMLKCLSAFSFTLYSMYILLFCDDFNIYLYLNSPAPRGRPVNIELESISN